MYKSQQNEDEVLFQKYLNYENGFFIELGAMDGLLYSNSYFYEMNLNWKGILIEPTDLYNSLIINRPNCYNFNYAISEIEGEVEFIGGDAIGGMTHTMDDKHRKGWELDRNSTFMVKSVPISKIVDELKVEKVDLFSIDVEGGELEVLKTFNWNIPVYIVLIEMAKHDLVKDDECREFLIKKGFGFDMEIGCNEVWINKNFMK
jgi:hypothetical protein